AERVEVAACAKAIVASSLTGSDVTVRNSALNGIVADFSVDVTNLQAVDNAGVGVVATSLTLVGSIAERNGDPGTPLDLLTVEKPLFTDSSCDVSQVLTLFGGSRWGICRLDDQAVGSGRIPRRLVRLFQRLARRRFPQARP